VFGTTGRILGPFVRDRKLFPLETAVHKMTGITAKRFGLTDRGELRAGAFADIVVFDPETVSDRATYKNPQQTCVGIEQVFVNGVQIVKDSEPIKVAGERQPGRALTYQPVA
jgi:N-acyl-D-amino-acid deacylase